MARSSTQPKAAEDRLLARSVERWFNTNQRDLPWRSERSGYAALVSEAMLQQTQVQRVVAKFESFMRRFPTLQDLARAEEGEVLAAWQGLGYYRRAKQLLAAARIIAERFGGEVPSDVESLRSLPGIGRYTAGAIASIAFAKPEPIVDTNVARVLMRLAARAGAAADPANVNWTWERAGQLVQAAKDPALFNEGLMELGATVCSAGEPRCGDCPLFRRCLSREQGIAASIPETPAPTKRRRVYHHAIVFVRGGRVLLTQRPDRGLWGSMWQVPTIEHDSEIDINALRDSLPFKAESIERERAFTHQTSHREVVFLVHRGRTRAKGGSHAAWVDATNVDEFALSNPMRAIVRAAIGIA